MVTIVCGELSLSEEFRGPEISEEVVVKDFYN